MLIRLEFENRTVHEATQDEVVQEIVIGRGKECAWRVTNNDPVISSQHAAIYRKGKSLWIRDLESKNGTFYRGKRITRMKLKPGTRIGIGNHVLWAEATRGTGEGKAASDVQVLTGRSRGQKKPVTAPALSIGSDPACGLVLLDPLVSRRHAEISLKQDGSCWIRDLGSKNGTTVNGVPMRDDKERLLKDRDRIGIAHLELEFHDGAVKRSSSQAWLRVGIIAATLIVCLALYGMYKLVRAPAEVKIEDARALARAEDFAGARAELEKAATARRAAAREIEIEDLRRLLNLWETTRGLWARGEQALEEGNWVDASRHLGMIQMGNKEAWTWNERALAEKERAILSKKLLDTLLRANASVRREDVTVAELQRDRDAVAECLGATLTTAGKAVIRLRGDLEDVKARLDRALAESADLEDALKKLMEPFPPYADVLQVIDKVRQTADGALKRRANLVRDPVAGLAQSFAQLNVLADQARAMEFEKVDQAVVPIPTPDACAVDPRVSQARANQESILENLKRVVTQVWHLHREIQKRLGGGETPAGLEALENPAVLAKVLACDSLDQPLPRRSRTKPSGEYDRVLGIEEFYTFLKLLPDPVDPAMVQWPFPSQLTETVEVVKRIRHLDAQLNEPGNLWMLGGKLAAEMKRLNALVARSEDLSTAMLKKLDGSSGRTALILGGIALALAREPKALLYKDKKLEAWLVAELKNNRNRLQELNNEYLMAALDRQIQLRDEILRLGLPGDPAVRQMWVLRSASQER